MSAIRLFNVRKEGIKESVLQKIKIGKLQIEVDI